MKKLFAMAGIKFIATLLDGYKTYAGGGVLILIGLAKFIPAVIGFIGLIFPDVQVSAAVHGFPAMDYDTVISTFQAGAATFGAGIAAIGIGHKIEKGATK